MQIDLHSHTHCSDGQLSPQALVDRATNFQIDMLAITDHDTVTALDIAKNYIEDKQLPLELVRGIEISTGWHGFEIHVVGLDIDHRHQAISDIVDKHQAIREKRAVMMAEKLTKCGFEGIYEKAKALAGDGSITRAHFARVLHQQGSVNTMQAAFDKYLGKGKRAYVKPMWSTIEQAVAAIEQAGGHAVLAHPIRYDLSAKWRRRLIEDFKHAGGKGLEIVLPQMNKQQRETMLSYCQDYDFYASMGSDFHFPSKWSDLGRNLTLPENCKPIWQLWQ
ncbi:PHP domain-containing protein [Thalassotalea agarivorans]|uniref:Polymerase/histidinol phosphatase N-terminal domain-containing protein n=1 Tax=Thalassotalea agarivorans TaxID=349064 RepID=A0A1I0EMW2_THASX|nr:PHP domain-containing protein [Thalassotalea agarivorans]SET46578.1 hypothetical protein SAMN05660429_01860 [Thalassotalea agarivorans]